MDIKTRLFFTILIGFFVFLVTIISVVSIIKTNKQVNASNATNNQKLRLKEINTFEAFAEIKKEINNNNNNNNSLLSFVKNSKQTTQRIAAENSSNNYGFSPVDEEYSLFVVNPFEEPDNIRNLRSLNKDLFGEDLHLHSNSNNINSSNNNNNKSIDDIEIGQAKKMSNIILYCNLLLKQSKMMYSIGYISKFLELLSKTKEYLQVIDPKNKYNPNLKASKKAVNRLIQGIKQFSKVPENKTEEAQSYIYDLQVIYETLDSIILRLSSSIYELETYIEFDIDKLQKLDEKYRNYSIFSQGNPLETQMTIKNENLAKPANTNMFVSPNADLNASNAFSIDPNTVNYVDPQDYQAEINRQRTLFDVPENSVSNISNSLSFPTGSNGNTIISQNNNNNTNKTTNNLTNNNDMNNSTSNINNTRNISVQNQNNNTQTQSNQLNRQQDQRRIIIV